MDCQLFPKANSSASRGALGAEALNAISSAIIGAAIKVHRALGPGLLESAYEACLAFELVRQGFKVERQKDQPLLYEGMSLDLGFRIDLLVNDAVVVEVKAVQVSHPIHEVQLLTYLRLSRRSLGLLFNFNVELLKNGVRRVVDEFPG